MKRILILAALLLATLPAFAQNGRSLYQKYSGGPDVSTVYAFRISVRLFRFFRM